MKAMLRGAGLIALIVSLSALTVEASPQDSLRDLKNGYARLEPTPIASQGLHEFSGLQWWQGAWWSHNDSGNPPVLFRADTPDFKGAGEFTLVGASNVDWEDLAIYQGDLMVCDIGNNRKTREVLTLYRVGLSDGRPVLKAKYEVAYPERYGQPQLLDAEAAFGLGDSFYVVSKNRGEGYTAVFRWDDLREEGVNVGELVGRLEVGDRTQITGADTDGEHVVLLSYTRIFVYPVDRLDGKPLSSTRIHAGTCEGICIKDGHLYFTSEAERGEARQSAVYVIHDYLTRGLKQALHGVASVELPLVEHEIEPDGKGGAWREIGYRLPLQHVTESESVHWLIAGGWLMIAGELRYDGAFSSSSEQGSRRGSGLTIMFTTGDDDFLTGRERFLWLGDNGVTGVDAWHFDRARGTLTPVEGLKVEGEVRGGWMRFEYALPLTAVFAEGELPKSFRANLQGFSFKGLREPRLSGMNIYSELQPYTWASVRVVEP